MEEKKFYSANEIREMFEAYDKYVKEIKSVEFHTYGIGLLDLFNHHEESLEMKKILDSAKILNGKNIQDALKECREKIPKGLLKKLGIDEPEKNIEVVYPKSGEKIQL
jgi:hypothetical protein